ncbi:MAG: SsrA-binding protein SmpB [Alphaproteobacteria bacterium]
MIKTLAKRIVAQNRRVKYDYHIEETYEAGIILEGSEVKSLRTGKANIVDAHAGEMKGEIYLFNAHIPEYLNANRFNHETKKPRKLLLHKKEVNKLRGKIKMKGFTLVAISIYFNERNRAKVEIGLAKGKKDYDRRQTEKERDWNREKSRMLKE